MVIPYDEVYMRDEEWYRLLLRILASVVGDGDRDGSIFVAKTSDAASTRAEPLRRIRGDHEKH